MVTNERRVFELCRTTVFDPRGTGLAEQKVLSYVILLERLSQEQTLRRTQPVA